MEIIKGSDIKTAEGNYKADIASEKGTPVYRRVDRRLQEDLYDFGANNINPLVNLNEQAALMQPFSNKLWRSTKNFSNLAGTTFLDGTIGTVVGLANMMSGGKDGKVEFNDFVDNPFSSALQQWVDDKRASNILYQTTNEQQKAWYEKLAGEGAANFWLGQLENAGFLVGALGAGMVTAGVGSALMGLNNTAKYSKLINALGKIDTAGDLSLKTAAKRLLSAAEANPMRLEQIGDDIIQMASKIKTRTGINQAVSSTLAAMGEARIEAISNGNDWEKQQVEYLKSIYGEDIPKDALEGLQEQKKYLQNSIFGLDTALLSLSYYSQFKNLFTGGIKVNDNILTNMITKNEVGQGFKFAMKEMSTPEKIARYIAAGAKNPLTEMTEEQLQFAVAQGSKDYYNLETDRDAVEDTKTLLSSMFKGLEEAYGTAEGWENAFAGALMGGLGLPTLKKNDKGNIRPVIGGGIANGIREFNNQLKATNSAVAIANKYATESNFRDLFNYMVTDASIQKAKDEATKRGFEAVARTQEKVQLANMVAAFSSIGQLDLLRDKINNVNSIIENANQNNSFKDYESKLNEVNQAIEQIKQSPASGIINPTSNEKVNQRLNEELQSLINQRDKIIQEMEVSKSMEASDSVTKGGLEKAASELRNMFAYTVEETVDGKQVDVTKPAFADLSDEALVSKIKEKAKKQAERIDKLEQLYQSVNTAFANHSEESRMSLYLNAVQTEDALERGNKILAELQQELTGSYKTSSSNYLKRRVAAAKEISTLISDIDSKERKVADDDILAKGNATLELYNFTKGRRVNNLVDLKSALKEVESNLDNLLTDKKAKFEEERSWRSAADLVEFSELMLDPENIKAFQADIKGYDVAYKGKQPLTGKGVDLMTLSKFREQLISDYYNMVTNEKLINEGREKKKLNALDEEKKKANSKLAVSKDVEELYKNLTGYVDGTDTLDPVVESFPEVDKVIKDSEKFKVEPAEKPFTVSKFVSGAIVLTSTEGSKRFVFKEGDPNTLHEQIKDSNGNWITSYITLENKEGEKFQKPKTKSAANFVEQVRKNQEETGQAFYEEIVSKGKPEQKTIRYRISYINNEDVLEQDKLDRIDRQYQARIQSLQILIEEQQEAIDAKTLSAVESINEEILTLESELAVLEKEYNERTSSNKYNSKQAKDKTNRLLNEALEVLEKLDNLKTLKEDRLEFIRKEQFNVVDVLDTLNKNLEQVQKSYASFKVTAANKGVVKNPEYLERINRRIADYEAALADYEAVKEDLDKYQEGIYKAIDRLDMELRAINNLTKSLKDSFNSLLRSVISKVPKGMLDKNTIDDLYAYLTSGNKIDAKLQEEIETLIELSYDYYDDLNRFAIRREQVIQEKDKLRNYKKIADKVNRLSTFEKQADLLKSEYERLKQKKDKAEREAQKKFSLADKALIETLSPEEGELDLYKATYVDLYGWAVTTGRDSGRGDFGQAGESSNPVVEERRFFRWLENEGLDANPTDYKLMAVTIHDEQYGLGKPNSVYNDSKKEGENHNEDDIRLILVDKNDKPIEAYGGVVYTKMRTLSTNFVDANAPRYSFYNKKLTAEQQKEILDAALDIHAQTRDLIKKNLDKKFYFNVTGFNPGTPIKNGSKTPAVGTVINTEEQIDDLDILVSVGEKEEKGTKKKKLANRERRIKYDAGRVLFKLGNTWVSAITRKINNQEAETVYQLLKAYLENYQKSAADKNRIKGAKSTEGLDLSYTSLLTYIQNIVYLSDKSKVPFDVKEDLITLGETTINLANIEQYKSEIIEALTSKVLNINNKTLASLNKKSDVKEAATYKSVTWNGFGFEETEWKNYKHYLVSTKNPDGSSRDIEEVPLTAYIRMKQVGATPEDIINDKARRFQQGYAIFEPTPIGSDSRLSAESKGTVEKTKPTEQSELAGINSISLVAPSGKTSFIVDLKNNSFTIESTVADPEALKENNEIIKNNLEASGLSISNLSSVEEVTALLKEVVTELGHDASKFTLKIDKVEEVKEQVAKAENKPTSTEDFFGISEEQNAQLINENSNTSEGATEELFRLFTGLLDTINIEESENWLAETLGIDIKDKESYERVSNLIEGIGSGRILKNGKILLSSLGEQGTEYHEGFHYVSNLLISKAEQVELWNEWRKINNKPDASDIQAEEGLAEDFATYMLTKKANSKKQESFFSKILNLIKSALGLNTSDKINAFYARIEKGEFKNAAKVRQNLEFTSLDSKLNSAMMAKRIHTKVVNKLLANGTKVMYVWNPYNLTTEFKEIYAAALNEILKEDGQFEKFKTLPLERKKEIAATVLQLHKDFIKSLGYVEKDASEYEEDFISDNEEQQHLTKGEESSREVGNEAFKEAHLISQKAKIKPVIKTVIAAIANTYEYDKTVNKLFNKLANSLDYNEMRQRLSESNDPAFKQLDQILQLMDDRAANGDWYSQQFRLSFYNTFFKHKENFDSLIVNRDGSVNRISSNTTRTQDIVLRKWQNNLLTVSNLLVSKKGKTLELTDKGKAYLSTTTTQALDFLAQLGINFTDNSKVRNYLNSDEGIEDLKNLNYVVDDLKSGQLTLDKLGSRDFNTNPSLSRLKRLVELEVMFSEDVVENVFTTAKGELAYSVTLHNYITKLIDKLSNSIIPSYLENDVYTEDSLILSRAKNNQGAVKSGATNGLSRAAETGEDVSGLSFKDYLLVELDNILSKNFSVLITGDKKTARTFQLRDFFIPVEKHSKFNMVKSTVDQMYKYYLTELKVINESRNSKDVIVSGEQALDDLIIFKNIKDRKGIAINVTDSEQVVKDKIKDYVEMQIESNLKLFKQYDIVKDNRVNVNNAIIRDLLNKKPGQETNLTTEEIERVVAAFTVNYVVSAIEQTKVFFGNPAYYTTKFKGGKADLAASFIDMFKRFAGAVATTKPLANDDITNEFMDKVMPRVDGRTGADRAKMNIVTFEDVSSVREELDILGVEGYGAEDGIDETDSFGIILDDPYRDLLFRSDSWSEEMNDAWLKESQGIEATTILPSLKPVVYGTSDNDVMKPFYVKFALLRLSPTLINAIKGDADAFPALNDLLNKMRAANGDIGVFKSGNKIGSKLKKTKVDGKNKYVGQDFYGADGKIATIDPELITELDLEYIGIQVENAPKDKKETSRGSQEAAIVVTDLAENGKFKEGNISVGGRNISTEQAVKELFDAQSQLTNFYLNKLKEELNLKIEDGRGVFTDGGEALKNILIEESTSRNELPDNQITALIAELESLKKGEPVYLDMLVNFNKLEPVLYSIFEKRGVNQKRFGKSLIQFPDTGTELKVRERIGGRYKSESLKFYGKNNKSMEVYLPWYFEGTLGKGSKISKIDPNNLKMYGFRIPTEQLNSLESIVVKGFLPKSYGNTCIVPAGITKKVGSDFDFDKINIYYPNFKKVVNDKISLKEFKSSYEYFNYLSKTERKALESLEDSSLESLLKDLNNYSVTSGKGKEGNLSESDIYKSLGKDKQELLTNLKNTLVKFNERKNLENKDKAKVEYEYIEPNTANLTNPELRDKALQNKILELTLALLESRDAKDRFEPNSISKFKDLSLKIEDKLQQVYPDRVKPNYSYTDLLNFKTLSTLRTMFWYGKDLVGIFALHNKNHPLAQVAGLKISNSIRTDVNDPEAVLDYTIRFKGIEADKEGNYTLGNVYTKDENGKDTTEKISMVTGQSVSLAVDVIKNPEVMERFNLNRETADVFIFLVRAGVPSETALYFISQPIIREYVEIVARNKAMSTMNPTKTEDIENLKAKYGNMKYIELTKNQLEQFNSQIQNEILTDFLTYKTVARTLSEMQSSFAFDTKGLGTTENIKDALELNANVTKMGNFSNLDRFGNFTFLNSFKKVYTDSISAYRNLLFTESNNEIRVALENFRKQILAKVFKGKSRSRLSKLMKNDFKAAVLTSNGKYEHWKDLFSGPDSLAKRLKRYQEEVKDERLSYLIPMIDPEGDGIDNVRLSNRKLNAYVMEEIANGIEEMFNKDATTKQLAVDLVKFSLLQSGYNFTQFSINEILPATFLRGQFKSNINNVNTKALVNSFNDFVRKFYINNWRNSDLVPFISSKVIATLALSATYYKAGPFVKTLDVNGNYKLFERIGLDASGELYLYQEIDIPSIANLKGKIWTNKVTVKIKPTKTVAENKEAPKTNESVEDLIRNFKKKFLSSPNPEQVVMLNNLKVKDIFQAEASIRTFAKVHGAEETQKMLDKCY